MAEGGGMDDGEKYFNLLNQMFVQDPKIDEMDIIFCPECKKSQEDHPTAFINEKHKLGIMSWCIQPLYMFAYNKLVRQRHPKNSVDAAYLSATDVLQLSRALLLLNAECYTVWNIRKDLVISGLLSVDDDLDFSTLVLSKYPRSAETFSHRKWTIKQYVSQKGRLQYCQEWLRKELFVCQYCVDHYPDNYVAWTHRGWITQWFIDSKRKLTLELSAMEKWVEMHISDHCGFHFRQLLLKKLKGKCSTDDMVLLLMEELVFISSLQESFPGHESIWSHRRFIFDHWNLWFCWVTNSELQELASISGQNSHENLSQDVMSSQTCWDPCVQTLSCLCRTAVVKFKSSYGKTQESLSYNGSSLPALPSFQAELDFCIAQNSKECNHFVSGYRNWLLLCCRKVVNYSDHSKEFIGNCKK